MKKKTYQYKYPLYIRWSDEDQCFFGEFPQLRGCLTHGSSVEEVIENANDAVETWLTGAKEAGIQIPEPVVDNRFDISKYFVSWFRSHKNPSLATA